MIVSTVYLNGFADQLDECTSGMSISERMYRKFAIDMFSFTFYSTLTQLVV